MIIIKRTFYAAIAFAVLAVSFFSFPGISSSATVTFNLNGDGTSWQDPDNWDTGAVPAASDDVVIPGGVTITGTASSPVRSITLGSGSTLSLNVTVTDLATFDGASNAARLTGNASFVNGGFNIDFGVVTGDATFSQSSGNFGGTVNGNATFGQHSFNDAGTVLGNATFNDTSFNWHIVSGNATFNGSSLNDGGTVQSNATFNDTSANSGTVLGDACFAPTATNSGTVNGTISVCDTGSGGYSSVQTYNADGSITLQKGGVTTVIRPAFAFLSAGSSSVAAPAAATSSADQAIQVSSSMMLAAAASSSAVAAEAQPSPSFQFTKYFSLGMSDHEVVVLQQFLNSRGFPVALSGEGSAGHETSFFGLGTRAALAKFQKSAGITPYIGTFGPITQRYVNRALEAGK